MLDYKPVASRMRRDKIEVILVEHPKEYGVFGAHGIGEPPMGPEGADHRQRRLQRHRRLDHRAADHPREGARGAQEAA